MGDTWEKPKARGVDITREGTTYRRTYVTRRCLDEEAARAKIFAYAPALLNGRPLDRVSISELGRGFYTGSAIWGPGPDEDDDQREFECDITTETQRITQAISSAKYPNVAATPDSIVINEAPDGRAEGVDWFFPDMPFSCVRTLADSAVTGTFIDTLWGLVTKTNSQPYSLTIKNLTLNFQVEELLFLGCRLRRNFADDYWTASYRFHARKSQTNLTVGTITGINKPGWRLLDVRYKLTNDAVAVKRKLIPEFVYVHQVAESANFIALGL